MPDKIKDETKKEEGKIETPEALEVKKLLIQLEETNKAKFKEIETEGTASKELIQESKDLAEKLMSRLDIVESKMITPSIKLDEKEEKNLKDFNIIRKSYGRNSEFKKEDMILYQKAFEKFLRNGNDRVLSQEEFKALQEGLDTQGGYTVRPSYSNRIIEKVFETSPMRKLATIERVSTDSLEILIDFDDFDAEYVKEIRTQAITKNAEFFKKKIEVHEISAKPKASLRLLEDSAINVENWLSRKLTKKFSRLDNNNFINGSGVGEPRGILTYPDGTVYGKVEQVESGTSGKIVANDILKLSGKLKSDYHSNAKILMSRQVFSQLLQEVGTDGHNIIDIFNRPTTDGKIPFSIAGYPVEFMQNMPTTIAGGTLACCLGDFKEAYTIVDRIGISILRDPYSADGAIIFKARMRTGGDVVNTEAYKILKIKA
ncbi:MAG: hypothetical protein BV456_01040 [Thermoplasmata archaeon M8B2D]|nr:MAG: hypothetical protein BV456_01040 [Thermoplasmata archaeon M8B2D]